MTPWDRHSVLVGNRQMLWTIMQRAKFDEHMRESHPEIPHEGINVSEAIQRLHRGMDSSMSPLEFALWLAAVVKEYHDVKKQSRPEYAAWLAGLRLRGMRASQETVDEAIQTVRRSVLGPHLKQLKAELDASEASARRDTEHMVKELVEEHEGSQSTLKKQRKGEHPDEGARAGGVVGTRPGADAASSSAASAQQLASPDASQGGHLADDETEEYHEEQIQEHEKWLAAAIATNRNLHVNDEEEEAPAAGSR